MDVAVSITPNTNIVQLLSQQTSGDRASLQIAGPKADLEWNAAPESDSSGTSQLADAFSAALLDAVGSGPTDAAQPSPVKSAPQIVSPPDSGAGMPPALTTFNGAAKTQLQEPAALLLPQPLQRMLSLGSSTSSFFKAPTGRTDQASSQSPKSSIPTSSDTQLAQTTQPAQVPAALTPVLPQKELSTGSLSISPTEIDSKTGPGGNLTVRSNDQPVETIRAAAPVSAAQAPAASNTPDHSLGPDSIVFEGELRSQPTTLPVQTVMADDAGSSNAPVTVAPNQASQAGPSNASVALPQSPGLQLGSPNSGQGATQGLQSPSLQSASTETSAHPLVEGDVSAPNAPAVPAGTSGSGDSSGTYEQGAKQDQKPIIPVEAKGEGAAIHMMAATADAPHSSQINPGNSKSEEVSNKPAVQPIAQQPGGPTPAVKTEMNLKVQGQSGENVTLRLSERSGSVQVTVRSADPGTTSLLKHELPSIQAGLERAGLQLQNMTSHQSSSSDSGQGNNPQSGSQEKKNQNGGSESQERQNKKNTSQDQWFDLMEGKS